jgi:biopolymer transport protein ExbB
MMSRSVNVLGVFMLLLLSIRGVGSDAMVLDEATARKNQAETQLDHARAHILTERIAIDQQLDVQQHQLSLLRQQLEATDAACTDAHAKATALMQENRQDLLEMQQSVDSTMIASRLSAQQEAALATASPTDRLTAALSGLQRRLDGLSHAFALSYARETIVTRNGSRDTVPVLRIGAARAIAIGTSDATRGVLVRTGTEHDWVVTGASLPGVVQASGSLHHLPIDPDNSLSTQQAVAGRTLGQWVRAGRFFIWPILAVCVIGIVIACERFIVVVRTSIDPRRILQVTSLLKSGQHTQAQALVNDHARPLNRIMAAGISAMDSPQSVREAVAEQSMLSEAPALQRGMSILMVLASIAPLLGLLGTVTGMIDMFSVIASHGSGNAKSLSGAISEALITTQAGMVVAVPLLVVHAFLSRMVTRRLMILEEGATAMLSVSSGTQTTQSMMQQPSTSSTPSAG